MVQKLHGDRGSPLPAQACADCNVVTTLQTDPADGKDYCAACFDKYYMVAAPMVHVVVLHRENTHVAQSEHTPPQTNPRANPFAQRNQCLRHQFQEGNGPGTCSKCGVQKLYSCTGMYFCIAGDAILCTGCWDKQVIPLPGDNTVVYPPPHTINLSESFWLGSIQMW